MKSPFGCDLPAGVTHAMIDSHMGGDQGEETCETCLGLGYIADEEEPACKIRCPDCCGAGVIQFSITERNAARRAEAAEAKADQARDERNL